MVFPTTLQHFTVVKENIFLYFIAIFLRITVEFNMNSELENVVTYNVSYIRKLIFHIFWIKIVKEFLFGKFNRMKKDFLVYYCFTTQSFESSTDSFISEKIWTKNINSFWQVISDSDGFKQFVNTFLRFERNKKAIISESKVRNTKYCYINIERRKQNWLLNFYFVSNESEVIIYYKCCAKCNYIYTHFLAFHY